MTAGMMRRPPDAPRAKLKPSVRRTIAGHMLQRGVCRRRANLAARPRIEPHDAVVHQDTGLWQDDFTAERA